MKVTEPSAFVYYKVPVAEQTHALRAARQLQSQALAAWPGLRARLWLRADEGDATQATVMESYDPPPGLSPDWLKQLQAMAQALGCAEPRHVETFRPQAEAMPDA